MYKLDEIGINGWYFRDKTPLEIIGLVREAGFSACEFTGRQLTSLNEKELSRLRSCARENGVRLLALNAACDLFQMVQGNIISERETYRKEGINHLKKCLEICAVLKIPKLIMDTGTSVQYFQSKENQSIFLKEGLQEISEYANRKKIQLTMIIIPYRRTINMGGGFYYVSYTRPEIFQQVREAIGGKAGWAFDTGNEMAGRQNMHRFSLDREVLDYLREGLDTVYLANHPGPMTVTLRRANYHDYLRTGYYTEHDYRRLFAALKKARFQGTVSLHLSVKEPDIKELKKERAYLECFI